jgi:hypothetical protein
MTIKLVILEAFYKVFSKSLLLPKYKGNKIIMGTIQLISIEKLIRASLGIFGHA